MKIIKWLIKGIKERSLLSGATVPGENAEHHLLHDSVLPIFTKPSARTGYDTRSIFKRRLTALNSEFSFS